MILIARDANFTGYDAGQLQLITDIANQCPLTGGVAVYLARGIITNETAEVADYENDCEGYLPPSRKAGKENADNSQPVSIAITNNNLIISSNEVIDRVTVCDLNNQKILDIENTTSQINLSSLSSGIYIIKINTAIRVQAFKLSLIK